MWKDLRLSLNSARHAAQHDVIRPRAAPLVATGLAPLFLVVSPLASHAQTSRTPPPPAPPPETRSVYTPPGPAKDVEVGNFYLKRRAYRAAASRFEEAIQSRADYAPAYLGLGKTYEKMGLKHKALSAYQQYLDLLPSDKDAEDAKDVHRAIARLRAGH
jgi:tetratricopeptide (TPR) repeat protein